MGRGLWQMLNKHWFWWPGRARVREMEKGQEGDNLSHLAVSVFLSRSPEVMSSPEARQCCSLHGPALPAPSLPLARISQAISPTGKVLAHLP